jgi:copper transport protein
MRTRGRRHFVNLVGALGLAVTIVVLAAAPAFAHATLITTIPTAGATSAESPQQIQLNFSENVEISLSSIQLFDQNTKQIDLGAPHHSSTSDSIVEATVPHLGNGAYVVTWRVISADSHPVHGAFTFTVGHSSADVQGVAKKLEAQSGGNKVVGVSFAIARAFLFAGIAMLIGGVVFAAAIRPHGRRRSRADALVTAGWITAFVATIAALLLQGPYADGRPITDAFHIAVVRAVLHTRYGHFVELRIALLLFALPLLLVLRKSWRPPRWWWTLAVPLGLAIAATPGLAGHAATGTFTQFAVPIDTVHVIGMSVWLGGLAALTLTVLDHDPDARRAATRFSPVALWSVVIIVASGVFAAWRQVGWSRVAFTDTTYGRILLVKIGVFIGLITLAAVSRRIVNTRRPTALSAAVATEMAPPPPPGQPPTVDPEVRHLRWSVGAELVFGIAVLVITSMLVNAQPARSALALPFSTELRQPTMLIDVTIDPAKSGQPIVIHLYMLTPSGANEYTKDATATLSLPSKGIPPIEVPLDRAGPNHFRNTSFVVPYAGKWQLVVRAFHTDTDEVAVQTYVNFR